MDYQELIVLLGKSFAKKLNGFDVNTIFYDIKKIKKDNYANP